MLIIDILKTQIYWLFAKKNIYSILITTCWIASSEFFRNSILLHHYWRNAYQKNGVTFPELPITGLVWGTWSLFFAIVIVVFSKIYTFVQTMFLSWFVGFILIWLVIWNLGFFPIQILPFAVPLSLLEVFIATFLIFKISDSNKFIR
jgi:hypothetical protein